MRFKGNGAPGQTRTGDPLLRRQTLYPTELRAHGAIYFTIKHLQPLLEKRQFQISVQSVQQRPFRMDFWGDRSQIQRPRPQPSACQSPQTDESKSLTCSLACDPSKKC